MARGIEMSKTSPGDVARAVVEGIVPGAEDIFPDPMSGEVYAAWRSDHKAVERQFATIVKDTAERSCGNRRRD